MLSCGISPAVSDPADLDEDKEFVQEQARKYLAAKPWERLAGRVIFMVLKAGSWYQACAQPFFDEGAGQHILFIFPGLRDMRDLEQSGSHPPSGTIMLQLRDRDSSFARSDGEDWVPLDRFAGQLLALALAALIDLTAREGPVDTEISGSLPLPGNVRGRYRAVLKPIEPGEERLVPVMSKIHMDLVEEGETTLSLLNIGWDMYRGLSRRAQLRLPSPEPFKDCGESIPVVLISDPIERARRAAERILAADPLNLALTPMATNLGLVVAGPKEGYCLTIFHEEAATARTWWAASLKSSGGAVALMVVDTTPDPKRLYRWVPANVVGLFEFGSQTPARAKIH